MSIMNQMLEVYGLSLNQILSWFKDMVITALPVVLAVIGLRMAIYFGIRFFRTSVGDDYNAPQTADGYMPNDSDFFNSDGSPNGYYEEYEDDYEDDRIILFDDNGDGWTEDEWDSDSHDDGQDGDYRD